MRFLTEHGLKAPRDVKIVGINNSDVARYATPALTSVDLPKSELGQEIARTLMRMIETGQPEAGEGLVRPHLVIRASTGGARNAEPSTLAPAARDERR